MAPESIEIKVKQINIGPINYNYYPSYIKPNPYKANKIDIK